MPALSKNKGVKKKKEYAAILLIFYFILKCFVSFSTDLKLQKELLSRSPIMTYRSDMKSLLMRDERGRPFEAILKGDTNFNLWSSPSTGDDVAFYLYTR